MARDDLQEISLHEMTDPQLSPTIEQPIDLDLTCLSDLITFNINEPEAIKTHYQMLQHVLTRWQEMFPKYRVREQAEVYLIAALWKIIDQPTLLAAFIALYLYALREDFENTSLLRRSYDFILKIKDYKENHSTASCDDFLNSLTSEQPANECPSIQKLQENLKPPIKDVQQATQAYLSSHQPTSDPKGRLLQQVAQLNTPPLGNHHQLLRHLLITSATLKKNSHFITHTTNPTIRRICNIISWVFIFVAAARALSSYCKYNTTRFWLPEAQRLTNYYATQTEKATNLAITTALAPPVAHK